MSHLIRLVEVGDGEETVIELDGQYIISANHDDHGWSGIQGITDAVRKIAKGLGVDVQEDYVEEYDY